MAIDNLSAKHAVYLFCDYLYSLSHHEADWNIFDAIRDYAPSEFEMNCQPYISSFIIQIEKYLIGPRIAPVIRNSLFEDFFSCLRNANYSFDPFGFIEEIYKYLTYVMNIASSPVELE